MQTRSFGQDVAYVSFLKQRITIAPPLLHQSLLNTKTFLCYLRLPTFLSGPERLDWQSRCGRLHFLKMATVPSPATQARLALCSSPVLGGTDSPPLVCVDLPAACNQRNWCWEGSEARSYEATRPLLWDRSSSVHTGALAVPAASGPHEPPRCKEARVSPAGNGTWRTRWNPEAPGAPVGPVQPHALQRPEKPHQNSRPTHTQTPAHGDHKN